MGTYMRKQPFSFKRFDQMTKDQFAAAMELGFAQERVDPLPPGHISLENKERGGSYAKWRRQGGNGKPLTPIYLGIEGGEVHQQPQAQIEDLQRIERAAKHLRKLGLAAEDNDAAIVLAALANASYFQAGGVLVGTRAFRCLSNHLGYAMKPVVATQDLDVAQPASIRLAVPLLEEGLHGLLQSTGLKFIEVPALGHATPSSSWRVVGREIKLDLLVAASRQHMPYQTVAIPGLAAHAIALEYLDYLLVDTIDAVAIGKSQLVPVRVPSPARFCWHKLAISQLRPATFSAKSDKDMLQAACLLTVLGEDDLDVLLEAKNAAPPAMLKLVKKAWPAFIRLFGVSHPAWLDVVTATILAD